MKEVGGRGWETNAFWSLDHHTVVFVQTGKTWEVVQACCNKRERDSVFITAKTKHSKSHYYCRERRLAKPSAKGVRAAPQPPLPVAPSKHGGQSERRPFVRKEQSCSSVVCPAHLLWARDQHFPGDMHTPRTAAIWIHSPS